LLSIQLPPLLLLGLSVSRLGLSSTSGLGLSGGGGLGVSLLGGVGLLGGVNLRLGLSSSLSGGSLNFRLLSRSSSGGGGGGSSSSLLFLGGGFDSLLSQGLEKLDVFSLSLLGSLPSFLLFSLIDSLSSESDIGDESLDFGGLPVGLSVLFNLSAVEENESSWIIFLLKIEQFSNSGGSLGSESSWFLVIGQTCNWLFASLDDGEGKNREIRTDNASSDGLSLSFTSSSGSIAAVSLTHENSGSSLDKNTLLHGETVLVVSTGDLEDISLVFIAKVISWHFGSHSLTEEGGKFLVVINNDSLLKASHRVGNV